MAMTSRERLLTTLRGGTPDRMPVFSVNQTGTYAQMDTTGAEWPAAHREAVPMAALAAAAHTVLGFDAVRVPYCQTIESEALGASVKYAGREGVPRIDVHPFAVGDTPELPGDFLTRGRIPELLEAVRILKRELGDRAVVMGSIVGPFSIVANLVGITAALKASFKKPEHLVGLLETAEAAGTALAHALVEAGADVVVIEDMMASIDVISPAIYADLAQPYEKQQLERFPQVPTILHICGKVNPIGRLMAETGASALSIEPSVDAPALVADLADFGRGVPLVGGVDAVETLFSGTPEDVRSDVRAAVADGYAAISPGCSIPPACTTENLRAMVEAVERPSG